MPSAQRSSPEPDAGAQLSLPEAETIWQVFLRLHQTARTRLRRISAHASARPFAATPPARHAATETPSPPRAPCPPPSPATGGGSGSSSAAAPSRAISPAE